MNKPLLLSLATATILTSSLNAQSMYERIKSMEIQMQQMQDELTTLRATKNAVTVEKTEPEAVEDEEDMDDEDVTSTTQEDDESDNINDDEDEDENDDTDETSDSTDEEDEEDDDEESIEDQIAEIQESITDLNKATNGSHIKFNVDYRFTLDNLEYKMAAKNMYGNDTQSNSAFMTNRLWINMNWKASDNLSFTGQLAYNKAFGARVGVSNPTNASYETFDWITNENPYDGIVRVRSVYFLYKNDTFIGADIPWTFSVGRRPSTNGHLVNLRDDDHASSPMGHTINVEFDGMSAKFGMENLTGIDGAYFKLCAGRGLTNASPKFSPDPFESESDYVPNIDLVGLIFVPYDDGQYGIATQYYYAHNLIDAANPYDQTQGFATVGNIHSFTANFTMNGIGDEWSDYLDDTFFFLSGAVSQTDPADRSAEAPAFGGYDPTGMLGSKDSELGYSVWVGLQMPSLMSEDGRWGVEYNTGSQYWRSITYAEDTNVGSKLAARGDAYEIYFTEPLVDEILSLQIRYTYIDYKYSGSNGFFGNTTGNAMEISDTMLVPNGAGGMMNIASGIVDQAQDIRFYLRYRY